MKDLFVVRWWRAFTRPSNALKPLSRPVVVPSQSSIPAPLARPQQLNTALKSLNDEFVRLNSKLVELRDALAQLRDALKQLDEANRKRAAAQQKLIAPHRLDLN